MSEVRINKFLASCGAASRREADKLVEEGRVTINGEIATTGSKVSEGDTVALNGKVIKPADDKVVLAYYKPVGVTVTEKDPHATKTIASEIKYPVRVTYAGRLDKDSTGLILLTNDGKLADELMRSRNNHEKEYVVTTDKPISDEVVKAMEQGVPILDTMTKPCKVFDRQGKTFHIILTQGLNRQIRRMCEYFGYKVTSLHRIRFVTVELGDLAEGTYRELTGSEIGELNG